MQHVTARQVPTCVPEGGPHDHRGVAVFLVVVVDARDTHDPWVGGGCVRGGARVGNVPREEEFPLFQYYNIN